jgi:hypothetical protein
LCITVHHGDGSFDASGGRFSRCKRNTRRIGLDLEEDSQGFKQDPGTAPYAPNRTLRRFKSSKRNLKTVSESSNRASGMIPKASSESEPENS